MHDAISRPNILPNDLYPASPAKAPAPFGDAQVVPTSDATGHPHGRHVLRHGCGVCEPVLGGAIAGFGR